MILINRERKVKFQNGCLLSGNLFMGALISAGVLVSSFAVSAGLLVWVKGFYEIKKWTEYIPKWMQFIEIMDLREFTPEINFIFYFSLACALLAAAVTILMLYTEHASSKKIGENNYKVGILNEERGKTISYLSGKGTSDDPIYVKLEEKYPGGCKVKSKSRKKRLYLNTYQRKVVMVIYTNL